MPSNNCKVILIQKSTPCSWRKNMQEQLSLRAYELTDTDFIHGLVNNPDIMAYWFEEPHHSKAKLEEKFLKEKDNPHLRSFILTKAEEQLGLIQKSTPCSWRKNMQEQLSLRAYELTDTDFIHGLVNNPDIMAYWFEEPHHSKAKLEEKFLKEKDNPHLRSFILTKAEEQLGLV